MKYLELERAARALEPQAVQEGLRELVSDPRFPALVRVLIETKEDAMGRSSQCDVADHHGLLAHAGGVTWGVDAVLGRVKELCAPPKRRGAQGPEES